MRPFGSKLDDSLGGSLYSTRIETRGRNRPPSFDFRTGANISSNSWGGGYSQVEIDAIDYMNNKGVLVVASAGNDNTDDEHWPGAYEGVMTVAATDNFDKRASRCKINASSKV